MEIIVDSNIIFSALIKNGLKRRLLLEHDGHFLFPSFIFEELHGHKAELLAKSGIGNEGFDRLLKLLLSKMLVVQDAAILEHLDTAKELVRQIDIEDAPFVACALAHPNSIIWSDDKKLKKLNKAHVFSTGEMMRLLHDD